MMMLLKKLVFLIRTEELKKKRDELKKIGFVAIPKQLGEIELGFGLNANLHCVKSS